MFSVRPPWGVLGRIRGLFCRPRVESHGGGSWGNGRPLCPESLRALGAELMNVLQDFLSLFYGPSHSNDIPRHPSGGTFVTGS